MVRRLPVLQTPPSEDAEAEARPAWQWVLVGAAFVVVLFLPLSVLGLWAGGQLARRFDDAPALRAFWGAAPGFIAYAIAATAAGAFIGRFGRRTPPIAVGFSGALGGAIMLALGALGGALAPWLVAVGAGVVLIGGGCIFALIGARVGRPRGPRPRARTAK